MNKTKYKTQNKSNPLSTLLIDIGILISIPSNFDIPPTNNDKAYQQNPEIKMQRSIVKKKEATMQNPANQRSNNEAT